MVKKAQFGEISKLSQEQIKQIDKSLEALYGKEYALQIRLLVGLPQQKPTEQLLTGWKFQAKKILGGLFNELVPEGATLLSTLIFVKLDKSSGFLDCLKILMP